jgi:PAS domain S-box-containing protein
MPVSELQALLRISQIDLIQDLDQILREILAIVTQEVGGTSGTAMLVNEETGELEMVAAFGLGDDYIDQVYKKDVPITCSPSGVVFETGTYYEVPNIFAEPRDKWWADLGRDLGFSAQLFMPMKRDDVIIGLLNIYMEEPHHYTDDEIAFVRIAANHSAAVIEKARLYQKVLTERKELENEIKARKQIEKALQSKDELLIKILEVSPIGIGLVDIGTGGPADRRLGWTNEAMMTMFGFKPSETEYMGQNADVIYASREEFERVTEVFKEKTNKGEPLEVDAKLKRRDGSIFDGYITMSFLDPSDPTKGAVATISDITRRKQAEEQIMASLKEKESLLREIHHRVKNNLQVISSLLNFQSRRIKDKEALEAFMDTQSRVKSMAIIYEKLYQSGDITKINFAGYITNLTINLFQSYRVDQNTIKLTTDIKEVLLDINTAIPCGLLINELISNALKHAFPDGKSGKIHISMHPIKGNEVELIVSDNGVGFPEELDFKKTESLGMQLVVSVVEEQLGGTIELNRSEGTAFKIVFRK